MGSKNVQINLVTLPCGIHIIRHQRLSRRLKLQNLSQKKS